MFVSTRLISLFIYSFLVLSLIFIYRAGSYGKWFRQQGPPHFTITILAFEQWIERLDTWTLTLLHNNV